MTNTEEYFEYRISSKFVGQIQVVFSIIVLVSGIANAVSFTSKLDSATGHDRDLAVGYITFSVLTIIVALTDIVFAIILISATQKISVGRCLMWRGSSVATLGIFGFMTIAFASMMRTSTIALGFLPSLIFKPFAIWVVSEFIEELRQLENFPTNSTSSFPPAKPNLSLQDPLKTKRTTTIFRRESVPRPPSIIASKITTIPEESSTL